MAAAKKNSRFFGIFSKKSDPDAVRIEMRKELRNLESDIHGINYDLQRLSRQRQKLIQKGTQAARDNDTLAAQEAGQELKFINAELAEVQQYKSTMVKTKLVCKITLRKLESTMPSGVMTASKRVIDILNDKELEKEIANKECSEYDFQRLLDRKLVVMMDDIDTRAGQFETDTNSEMELFVSLARAEEEGDTEKIRSITAQLNGESDRSRNTDDMLG